MVIVRGGWNNFVQIIYPKCLTDGYLCSISAALRILAPVFWQKQVSMYTKTRCDQIISNILSFLLIYECRSTREAKIWINENAENSQILKATCIRRKLE